VVETRKRVLGAEHPDTLTTMNNLAWTWKCQGRDIEVVEFMSNVILNPATSDNCIYIYMDM